MNEHYTKLDVEPLEAMRAWMTHEQYVGFLRGNVIKYLARADHKGGVDDYNKALDYLARLVKELTP